MQAEDDLKTDDAGRKRVEGAENRVTQWIVERFFGHENTIEEVEEEEEKKKPEALKSERLVR